MREAAERLGYSRSGLQKLVDNTKRRGKPPYISFLQTGKGAHIKFLPEWLGEFVDAYSYALSEMVPAVFGPPPRKTNRFELDLSRLDSWPS